MGSQLSCDVYCGDKFLSVGLDCEWRPNADQSSWCGSDAFYRDAFLEDGELEVCHVLVSNRAVEQAYLKGKKTDVFLRHALTSVEAPIRNMQQKLSLPRGLSGNADDPKREPIFQMQRTLTNWKHESDWVGTTIPEWQLKGLPNATDGPRWKKGDGVGMPLRCGPDYLKTRTTAESQNNLYSCVTLDAIKACARIDHIIGHAVKAIPPPASGSAWTRDCPLPRVICINVMIPNYNPKNPWAKDDGGSSFVGFFEINAETIESLASGTPSPAALLFQQFFEGPAGIPGGPADDPNRSLRQRRNTSKTQDRDSGLLRASGWCENEDELGVPEFLRQFNGKSFLITDSGYIIKDPQGEWLEIGFDVRLFNILFRDALYNFRHFSQKAQFHLGFNIQGVANDELPEALLFDMYLAGVNILDHPREVQIPQKC